jgi:CPA1 family monovalent cation:H+ antiporter
MPTLDLLAVLIVLTAAFGYVNVRLLKLPPTIGLMALTLLFSAILLAIGRYVPTVEHEARLVVEQFDFDRTLLHGMLGFLLFAGALHIDINDLRAHKWPITVLAGIGVLLSTAIVGGAHLGPVAGPRHPLAVHRLPALRRPDLAD